jgi:beta-xylosidase
VNTTLVARAPVTVLALVAVVIGPLVLERTAPSRPDAPPDPAPASSSPVFAPPAGSPTTPIAAPPLVPNSPADDRDAPDPFILADGDEFVLYTTQVGWQNVPVSVSPDLAQWSAPSDALPDLPDWAEWGRTWAPGALAVDDAYVLYFAARVRALGIQCIGVAAAPSATGPFVPQGEQPLVCQPDLGGSIDPAPFRDANGDAFLLWKSDANAIGGRSTLFSQRLRADGLAFEGDAVALLASDASWEQPLIENPTLATLDGGYLLFYSGGWWESASYAIGYARCDTPLGPCQKVTIDGPLAGTSEDEAGPGGACLVSGPDGTRWLAYHAWTPGAIGYSAGGRRSLRFAAIHEADGVPVLHREPKPSD